MYVPASPDPTIAHIKQVDQNPWAKNIRQTQANEVERLAVINIHLASNLSVRPTYIGVKAR